MRLSPTSRKRTRRAARRRAAALAAGGAIAAALLGPAALFTPAAADASAPAADPGAPFTLPALTSSTVITSPDQLRTGGVACPAPAELTASNAGDGSGQGYRVPFEMALTDGRALAGYSPLAAQAGNLPFTSAAFGITGWIRGWVELPSLKIDIPDDGTTMCSGAGAYWSSVSKGIPTGLVIFTGSTGTQAEFFLTPEATQASITGVAPNGVLELQASVQASAELHEFFPGFSTVGFDCAADLDLSLSTEPQPLVTQFGPIVGPFDNDPSYWGDNYALYKPEYPADSTPPDHYYMPPSGLTTAADGGSATVADATAVIPAMGPENPSAFGQGCGNTLSTASSPATVAQVLNPRTLSGNVEPDPPPPPPGSPAGTTTSWGQYYSVPIADQLAGVPPENGFATPAGAVQSSVDITVSSLGVQSGLPSGFGFS